MRIRNDVGLVTTNKPLMSAMLASYAALILQPKTLPTEPEKRFRN